LRRFDPKSPGSGEQYYQALTANSTADVLFVTPDETGIEATRAGYLLDLKPLVNADARFDPADYSPAVERVSMDSRLWALRRL
jgi:maltose-binding protein MalE